jgi:hypothetical protein
MGRNAHIRYDINDGLASRRCSRSIVPTEEQKSERARVQKEKKDKRTLTKEEEQEIKGKYRPRSEEDA